MLMRISFALVRENSSGALQSLMHAGYPGHKLTYLPRPVEEELLGPNGLSFNTEDYRRLDKLTGGWFSKIIGGTPSGGFYNIIRPHEITRLNGVMGDFLKSPRKEVLFFEILLEGLQKSFERLYVQERMDINDLNVALVISPMKGSRQKKKA